METLATLAKLAKERVNQELIKKQQKVEQRERIIQDEKTLLLAYEQERSIVNDNPDPVLLQGFATYSDAYELKKKRLSEQRTQLELQLAIVEEALQDAFTEYKSYEVIDQNQKRRQQDKMRKVEQGALDAIALMQYQRMS